MAKILKQCEFCKREIDVLQTPICTECYGLGVKDEILWIRGMAAKAVKTFDWEERAQRRAKAIHGIDPSKVIPWVNKSHTYTAKQLQGQAKRARKYMALLKTRRQQAIVALADAHEVRFWTPPNKNVVMAKVNNRIVLAGHCPDPQTVHFSKVAPSWTIVENGGAEYVSPKPMVCTYKGVPIVYNPCLSVEPSKEPHNANSSSKGPEREERLCVLDDPIHQAEVPRGEDQASRPKRRRSTGVVVGPPDWAKHASKGLLQLRRSDHRPRSRC